MKKEELTTSAARAINGFGTGTDTILKVVAQEMAIVKAEC